MATRAPKETAAPKPANDGQDQPETETLNFKVKSQFKREFKVYAVSRGMTMVELLEVSYQLYKEKHDG